MESLLYNYILQMIAMCNFFHSNRSYMILNVIKEEKTDLHL